MTVDDREGGAEERYLDLWLEELVGGAAPPDVWPRVAAQAPAGGSRPAATTLGRPFTRSWWMVAAVVIFGVSIIFGILRSRSDGAGFDGRAAAPGEPAPQGKGGPDPAPLSVDSLAAFQRHLAAVQSISIAVTTTTQHNVYIGRAETHRRTLAVTVTRRLKDLLGKGLRRHRAAGWKWPNEIHLHLGDGRYLTCAMYMQDGPRLCIRNCGDYSMTEELARLLADEIAAIELATRLREGVVFSRADLERRGALAIPDDIARLRCYDLADADLAALGRFGGLRELDLGGCHKTLRGPGLAHLAKVPSLGNLALRYTGIDDAGLARLGDHPGLRELDLSSAAKITGTGFAGFATESRLQTLKLGNCRAFTDAGLRAVAGLASLRDLDVGGRRFGSVTGAGLVALGEARGLRRLVLHDTRLPIDVVLAGLGALPDLQELDLSGTAVTAIGLASCASRHYADTGRPIPPLRRLHLGRCKGIAGRALEIIAGFAQLEELDLTRSGLVSRGVVAAAEREGAADFVALGRLQRLRSLSLSGVRLAPGDCRAIAGLPQLETLDLSFAGDGIDDTALGHLGNMRGLRDLRLAGCDAFTDDGLARLGGMRQLRRLDLNVCAGFTAAGVKGLREALADLEVALPQRLR